MSYPDRNREIRSIAYGLWEEAGRPDGRHLDFWCIAERRFDVEDHLEEGLEETFPASDTPTSLMRSVNVR